MNGPAMVADHLDRRADAVIASWRLIVQRIGDVPRSESLSQTDFRDHVPLLLDRMADRLRGVSSSVTDAAEQHGHMRYRQGYDAAEVVAELGHLRTVLTQATFDYARSHRLDLHAVEQSLEAIQSVLNEATTESVRQFQEDTLAENQATIEAVRERSELVEEARLIAEVDRGRLRVLLESLPVGVWVSDAEGRIVLLNRMAEAMRLFPSERSANSANLRETAPILQQDQPDGSPSPPMELPLVRALRGEVILQEVMAWTQPDAPRFISVSAAPLRNTQGVITGAVAVVDDVTARKQMAADLQRMTSQLRAIVEQSPVMIWRTDTLGAPDFVNRTFLEYIGGEEQDDLDQLWDQVIHDDDREANQTLFRNAFEQHTTFINTVRMRRNDGQIRWVVSRGVPFHDELGAFLGYLGTCIDQNDRVELEQALHRQSMLAEESSQHKSRLMSALSHDARTPLNAVVLSAQLLELHVKGDEDPEVEECLRTIRNGVKNVMDLLGDLLDLTRIDAGAMPTDMSRFPLGPTLSECVSSIEPQARLKGLECRIEPGSVTGLTVEADRAKLKQILSNFLSNALRYTDRGHIRLKAYRTSNAVAIAVEDTGHGIAPGDQARVFDEFATLENSRRPEGEGTGLGLAICRRLAKILGGEIHLDSQVGFGSTFTLVLPDSIIVAAETPQPHAPRPLVASREGAILVVEDHPDSRRTLCRLLSRMGYRALEASDGQEALDLARLERPLAVLMDVNMPGMDGIDATTALRADPTMRGLAIFALTGDVSTENRQRIGEAGVDGYLEKPVTSEALKQALAAIPAP